ncbi:MAG TPA: cytochrome c [Gammaproteobacteria bacterium]|nr:cytochrome c [Gammaproteobacteria bacterium]
MGFAYRLILLLAGLTLAAPFAAASDLEEAAIKARQGQMQLRSFNAGPLFAMVKGDIEYDAEFATTLANNLKLMLGLDNGRAWMRGTSTDEYPDKTTALPAIWEADSEIGDRGKDYADAVKALAGAAGQGRDALRSAVKDLGGACKGCHDDYRQED